jgi:glutamyl-tRNA reductase
MHSNNDFLSEFCVAGINYRKSDVIIRGNFSLTKDQSSQLLTEIKMVGIPSGFVLSTCNRTEVYGIGNSNEFMKLLCLHTHGSLEDFRKFGYVKQGYEAVEHLFKVAAGLDSQIIGDYEILSQLKQSIKTAQQHGCINSFTERIINYVLQASKEIKTKTNLSSGTVSVAYAAIEIIKEKIDWKKNKILLVGTGKFGNSVAENIDTYLPGAHLTVANRTDDKAIALASQYNAAFIPFNTLSAAADNFDIIIVSSSSDKYTITPQHLTTQKERLLLDLSVPQNIDPAVKNIGGVELMNVDEISAVMDSTILMRQAEVPKAIAIINKTINELLEWNKMQSNSQLLQKVKLQLRELTNKSSEDSNVKIHKTVSSLAKNLRKENNKGCQYIHALNNYLHPDYEATA